MLAADFQHTENLKPLTGIRRLALAVSGGSDSMAMLRMVHAWASTNTKFFVLTVDHGLRLEAAEEALRVASWCAELNVTHTILKWQHGKIDSGIQAKARAARYDLMSAWCLEHDVSVLLTAHTADDQAETVAMRKQRTSSAESLAGIWPEREWRGVRVLRPLLNMRRLGLRTYLKSLGQDWLEDPSNHDSHYERVRVRTMLDGKLSDFPEMAKVAQQHVLDKRHAAKLWGDSHFKIYETGHVSIDRKCFSELSVGVAENVVKRMIDLCGAGPRRTELDEHLQLLGWLSAIGEGRRCLGGAIFAKRSKIVLVGREAGRIAEGRVFVPPTGEVVWDGRFSIEAPANFEIRPLSRVAGIKRRADLPAFVQAGLPAVLNNGVLWSVPHLGIGANVAVKFLRH